jgi:GNAT superfamily N-acetyltransferase
LPNGKLILRQIGPLSKLRDEAFPNVKRDTWYLHEIATLQRCQGKGYAKALLKHIEQKAREEGKKAALLGISANVVS